MCQDTQLCHFVRIHNCVLVFFCCSNIFIFIFKAFFFYFLFSIIEIFQMPSTENYIQVHNSVVCLEGTLLCPAAFLRSWFFWFFQSFPLPFPLLAKVFSFQLISFLVSFIWNSQKWPVSQNIWCLIKTQLKNITQTIFQEGSPWATLIHYKCYYFIRENDDKPEDSRVPNSQIPSRSPGRHEEAKERERVAHVVRETTRLHIEHF